MCTRKICGPLYVQINLVDNGIVIKNNLKNNNVVELLEISKNNDNIDNISHIDEVERALHVSYL